MKKTILAFLMLLTTAAFAQTPADFIKEFITYVDGSIKYEQKTNLHRMMVQLPSHYDQTLLVSKMNTLLAKHPLATYGETWILESNMRYRAALIYDDNLISFSHDTTEHMVYIIWSEIKLNTVKAQTHIASTQTPADFVEEFIIYLGGSIRVENVTDLHSMVVELPSHYDQSLLVSKMSAHMVKHPSARITRTWRFNSDMRYEAHITYSTTPIVFEHDTVKKVLYIVWQK